MRWNVALLGLLVGISPSHGAVRHVPSQYATINAALDVSAAGDSVLVAPGTYTDYEVRVLQGGGPFTASSVAFMKGGVSLIGEGGREVTRIDMAGQGSGNAVPVMAYDLGAGTILLQGFTITGAPVGNAGMWCRFLERTVIRSCRFEDLDGSSQDAGGVFSETTDLEVYDTTFANCRAGTGLFRKVATIEHIEGDATLERCRFVDCIGPSILVLDALGVNPPFNASLRECEFRDNTGTAAVIGGFVTLTVEECAFVGNAAAVYAGLTVSGGGGGIVEPGPYNVRRNLFARNTPRCMHWDRVSGSVEGNTFIDCGERALTLSNEAQHEVNLLRNIVAGTDGSAVRLVASTPPPSSECNLFWENTGGHTQGFGLGPTDVVADPLFCGPDSGDYTVAGNSPCLPPQSGLCGQIGTLGEGCSGVAIEAETWARMKAHFRNEPDGREAP